MSSTTTPSASQQMWARFISELNKKGMQFAEVQGTSSRLGVLGECGFTGALELASLETTWAELAGKKERKIYRIIGLRSVFRPDRIIPEDQGLFLREDTDSIGARDLRIDATPHGSYLCSICSANRYMGPSIVN